MPRPPRCLLNEACYHVLTRGNNRAAVFYTEADRQRYGQWLLELSQAHQVQIYHYCLMTNHVHLVVWTSSGSGLRHCMQRLNLTYAQYLHRIYGHVGHVWQDRFKSLLIGDDAHLLQCGAYIELNPVRAKMVITPEVYPWSSYRVYAHGQADPLINLSPAYLALGQNATARQQRYRQFVEQQPTFPLHWFQQPVLGTSSRLLAHPRIPRPRGRPRKVSILDPSGPRKSGGVPNSNA